MVGDPIEHGARVADVAAGALAQKPLVTHDLLAFGDDFAIQTGLRRDRLRELSRKRLRRGNGPIAVTADLHTPCNMSRTAFFSIPKIFF